MTLKRHKQFLKDFNKCRLTDGQFQKLVVYLNALASNSPLPPESKDHSLEGNYADCREFHLGSDMLVVYLIGTGNDVTLLRMGTHAQLFK